MAEIARFAALIIDSNTPPKCSAAGGFQYHSTPLFAVVRRICSWSCFATNSGISLSAATKFDQLSLTIFLGQPPLAVILVNAFMKLRVSWEVAISKWQQWVCKQPKRQVPFGSRSSTSLNGQVRATIICCTVCKGCVSPL